ncbi:ISL3 family transposase [Halalkalibacterium halodurans]|uniref:ISL3 family transposase n=1 Tax=Halalkalibacterium halodurans TaxID=86665 RepID=UPI00106739EE|nr:ISL3 family transposase [Halalkalibacterium halodurans]TES48953.1 ISL3 family transposase [Halalkalibacterium halodurans]
MKTNICLPLGLPEFVILKQEILKDFIYLDVETNEQPKCCIHCGFSMLKKHDQRMRKVRDLDLLDKTLYLFVHVKRWRCQNCQEVFSEPLSSIPAGKHQTYRFRRKVFEMCIGTTISDVSRKLKVSYKTVERIYYDIASKEVKEHSCSGVIGIDEVAVRKGHNYETVVTDIQTGSVHQMGANRDYDSTITLLKSFEKAPSVVVMDMWKPFFRACKTLFPKASIVIDKYHVVQKINLALDAVRKSKSKEINGIKKGRFCLLKRRFRLTEKQFKRLEAYHDQSEELAHAYYLKEWFYDLYQQPSYKDASTFLDNWIKEARMSPFPSFHDVCKTLETWKPFIRLFTTFCGTRTIPEIKLARLDTNLVELLHLLRHHSVGRLKAVKWVP